MGINISRFKFSRIDLALPLDFTPESLVASLDQGSIGARWLREHPPIFHLDNGIWTLDLIGGVGLSGTLDDEANLLRVTDLDWHGEFSGILYHDVLLPLFRQERGNLQAIVVWEEGDTIERLVIQDGEATKTEIT